MRMSRIHTGTRCLLLLLLSWNVSVQSYIYRDAHQRRFTRDESSASSALTRTTREGLTRTTRSRPTKQQQQDKSDKVRITRQVELLDIDSSSIRSRRRTSDIPLYDQIGHIGAVAAMPPPRSITLPSTATTAATTTATLSPLEAWCLTHLDRCYNQSQAMKCPFLRRRLGDILDNVETILKHTTVRRQCWPLMGPPQAWRPAGVNKKLQRIKYKGLSLEELRSFVWKDWKPETGKGYYVTGKLTTAVYRDDCMFSGPDPDMPIQGLRKYVGVAAHLFDFDQSCATLKSLEVVGDSTLEAEWQLMGIIRLPWHPHLPTFSGKTVYHVDTDGLIERHDEVWNISVAHAFCYTLFPDLAKRIWKEGEAS